jgi:hypothetical protein
MNKGNELMKKHWNKKKYSIKIYVRFSKLQKNALSTILVICLKMGPLILVFHAMHCQTTKPRKPATHLLGPDLHLQ